jgi:hypothetical protein
MLLIALVALLCVLPTDAFAHVRVHLRIHSGWHCTYLPYYRLTTQTWTVLPARPEVVYQPSNGRPTEQEWFIRPKAARVDDIPYVPELEPSVPAPR